MSEKTTSGNSANTEAGDTSEWEGSKLEDVVSNFLTGGRPSGGGLDEGEYISIGGTQVNSEGFLDFHDLVYIPEDYFERVEETQLRKHDILVVKDGANTGDVAIAWENDDRVVTNEHLFTIRTDSNLNSPYLFYYLLSHRGWKQIHGTITGSAQKGINRGFAGKVTIEYPPLEEQQKIATVLYTVDKTIEKTEEIIDRTTRVREGLQQILFRDWSEDTNTDPLVGRYPANWELKTLSEVVTITDAEHFTPDYVESGIPVLRPGDLSPGRISLKNVEKRVDEETYEELTNRCTPSNEDIVYSRSQNFAVASQVLEEDRFCLGQDMVVIEPETLDESFLLHLLNSSVVRNQAVRRSTGSTFSRVNLGDIRSYKVPVPPNEIQQQVGGIIDKVEDKIRSERKTQNQLYRLKQGLMQDLLSGTVRTTDADIEIPNEVTQHG
jgi:type I restriction enzyme S subunit